MKKRFKNIDEYAKYLEHKGTNASDDDRAILVLCFMVNSYKDKDAIPPTMLPHILIELAKQYHLNANNLLDIFKYLLDDKNYRDKIRVRMKNLVKLDIDYDRVLINDNLKTSYE